MIRLRFALVGGVRSAEESRVGVPWVFVKRHASEGAPSALEHLPVSSMLWCMWSLPSPLLLLLLKPWKYSLSLPFPQLRKRSPLTRLGLHTMCV